MVNNSSISIRQHCDGDKGSWRSSRRLGAHARLKGRSRKSRSGCSTPPRGERPGRSSSPTAIMHSLCRTGETLMQRFSSGETVKRKKGLLFVVSAPSGAGKTSLCRAITDSLEDLTHSISYATRKPTARRDRWKRLTIREQERFRDMIQAGDFAEWLKCNSNPLWYSRRVLDDMISKGPRCDP